MVQHGESLAREAGDAGLAEAVASGRWEGFPARLRAVLRYAVALTVRPADVREIDVEALRRAGLDDRGIVDANQIVSYFNYVNRIADGLGVELECAWPAEVRRERSYSLGTVARFPAAAADAVPWISVGEMREVDRVAVEEAGIDLARMMENAGRNLAVLARALLGGDAAGRRVLVLAGSGGNGGGGLVAARHLLAAGAAVSFSLAAPADALAPVTREQLAILEAIGVEPGEPRSDAELVVDAVLGYGQAGAPRGRVAELVEWTRGRRVLSLDVPTGVALETSTVHEPHVDAEATMTLALPKDGLLAPQARAAAGELFLGDLSIPDDVYERIGIPYATPFRSGPLVRVAVDEPWRWRLDRA